MAISAVHYWLIRELFEKGLLPQKGALLEIGEANNYDVPQQVMADDIRKYVADPQRRDQLLDRLAKADQNDRWYLFEQAKVFYEIFFEPVEIQAVDLNGSPIAQKLDLNGPIELNRKFDVVINHGTAEHVFNIAQVFRTIHESTVPGGIMIHEAPFLGWIEHGFYNLQPTLFFDLAEFNLYEIQVICIEDMAARSVTPIKSRQDVIDLARQGKIPNNSLLFVAFRKNRMDRPFQVPQQGYYRGVLPEGGADAWKTLR